MVVYRLIISSEFIYNIFILNRVIFSILITFEEATFFFFGSNKCLVSQNVQTRYNKPLQSSVRAVTAGTLWALKREDFREILTSEFPNIAPVKLLRSIEPLSSLTILQLSRIAESLFEVSFSDGQKIIEKVVLILAFLAHYTL